MRLSWNEVRARAADFAREWADAAYEKGETHSFYNDFFEIFGVKRRMVARYEEHVRRLDDTSGFIDLFWPGVLLVEQKSAGRGLAAAREQAGAYFDALPEGNRPCYQLLCDFRTFELLDRDEGEECRFALELVKMRLRDVAPSAETSLLFDKVVHRTDLPRRTDRGPVADYRTHKHTLYGRQEGACGGCSRSGT